MIVANFNIVITTPFTAALMVSTYEFFGNNIVKLLCATSSEAFNAKWNRSKLLFLLPLTLNLFYFSGTSYGNILTTIVHKLEVSLKLKVRHF